MKTFSTFTSLKLENPLFLLEGIKIQQQIKDHPRPVKVYHYCKSLPKKRNNPQLYGISKKCLEMIGLEYEATKMDKQTPFYLSGTKLIQLSQPVAHNYCGHQFGVWAGQLGDGRAHTLGSVNHASKLIQLQLKGSGFTPFSRHADGNSVVSSAVRQFLASQLMAGLKIPTTRALSLVIADEVVKRDPMYNGNIKLQKAAIVMRMCETFIRFGSFQVCLKKGNMNTGNALENRKILKTICDWAIKQHFKQIDYDQTDPYEEYYKEIVKKSAQLVAYWQSIGFVHGVLNTDNMSAGGVTIDYGPYGFIDYFSKDFVSNASDQYQRYSYRRQPDIFQWNLQKLAEAMDPLFPVSISKKYLKQNFKKFYEEKYYQLMANKLGLQSNENTKIMHYCGTHFTNFFRIIQSYSKASTSVTSVTNLLEQILLQSEPAQFYLKTLRAFPQLLKVNYTQMFDHDPAFNPYFITEQQQRISIQKTLAYGDCKQKRQRQKQKWQKWVNKYLDERKKSQINIICNPKYVLLNFIGKSIAEQLQKMSAEQSLQMLQKILSVFENPYEKNQWFEQKYWKQAPTPVKLTCSS